MDIREQPPQQFDIFDKDAHPRPCNNFTVGFSPDFFMLKFAFAEQRMQGNTPIIVMNRLGDFVVSPQQAQYIMKAMQAKLDEYETQYGKIEIKQASGLLVPSRNIVTPS